MELNLFVGTNIQYIAPKYDSSYMKFIYPENCHNELDNFNNKTFDIMYMIYDVYQNLSKYINDDTKYIGFNQKRRYFDIDYNSLLYYLKEGYSILAEHEYFYNDSIIDQYNNCCDNSNNDLLLIRYIINTLYPEYISMYDTYMNGNILNSHNIFITDIDTFKQYMDFAFNVMKSFCEYHNFNNYKDIYKYIIEHKERFPLLDLQNFANKYSSIEWNARICGFILERLTSMWFNCNRKIKEIPLIVYDI